MKTYEIVKNIGSGEVTIGSISGNASWSFEGTRSIIQSQTIQGWSEPIDGIYEKVEWTIKINDLTKDQQDVLSNYGKFSPVELNLPTENRNCMYLTEFCRYGNITEVKISNIWID